MVPFCMTSPARMKKGTASRGKLSSEDTIFSIMNSGGMSPTYSPVTTPSPMATAMGALRKSRMTMTAMVRMMVISIRPPLSMTWQH